ncbi:hypothetical protein OEZ85_006021 [Tetradesmus obliquus]|uniref:Uncharacterized protein n=1 Tax=Tetradesmus obliquus TaxID=3088 RepID=A0ABY8UF94_TETOB|nr:hypothetical protein OEZ85_006021 [Tetradesmus obliquus]
MSVSMAGCTSATAACGVLVGLPSLLQGRTQHLSTYSSCLQQALTAAVASNSSSSGRTFTSSSSSSSASAADALPPELTQASEGPAALYTDGIKSGAYRPDPLQQVTVQKLQVLYDDLRAANPKAHKPSGLTLVDSVGVADSTPSW